MRSNINLGLFMDMEQPQGSRRLRARRTGPADGTVGPAIFRIEDAAGRLLRRIRDARNPQEALALYWRRSGAAIPGAGPGAGPGLTMSKDLERRIRQARADALRTEMQTPELPFEADPAQPLLEIRSAPRRGRGARVAGVPQIDLFGEAPPGDRAPLLVAPENEPEPDAGPAPEAAPQPTPVSDPEPYALDAQLIALQRVDARNLRPTDRADSYLYHVTNGPDANAALRSGLVVSASDPVILTERQGVAYWLSVLVEDYDYILDGPADFVVLRLRRMAVEELLEADSHASRSAGCACYLLTGGRSLRGRD